MSGTRLSGRCHCGNLRFSFETRSPPEQLPIRACACTFCRRHRARTASDPAGRVRILVADAQALSRYRFGLETADFLICRRCGVYLGAVMSVGGQAWATVNINTVDVDAGAAAFPAPQMVDYGAETRVQRQARRRVRWTPVIEFVQGV